MQLLHAFKCATSNNTATCPWSATLGSSFNHGRHDVRGGYGTTITPLGSHTRRGTFASIRNKNIPASLGTSSNDAAKSVNIYARLGARDYGTWLLRAQTQHADSSTTRNLPRFDYDGIIDALSGAVDAFDGNNRNA